MKDRHCSAINTVLEIDPNSITYTENRPVDLCFAWVINDVSLVNTQNMYILSCPI